MSRQRFDIHRRKFLITSLGAGAGLTLGVYLGGCDQNGKKPTGMEPKMAEGDGEILFEPNAFVRITDDNRVIVIIKHLEMGQGTYTGLAALVAEELDADWSQIVSEGAPADASRYNNLFWGQIQGTGGSTAMPNSFNQMRQAGATARHMLVAAAAEQWHVDTDDIQVEKGIIKNRASEQQASFGELADLAAQQPVPDDVFLKEPDQFTLIGTTVPRKDSKEKVHGTAIYTQDIQLPEMLVAVVAHPPRFGARVKQFDAGETRKVRGVHDVIEIPNGVAVVAEHTWAAIKGRDALSIEWDESNAFNMGSDQILADYKQRAQRPGNIARQSGNSSKALNEAAERIDLEFEFPYLAHAPMEPLNCVVQRTDAGVTIWNGVQSQTADQQAVAKLFGIKPEQVTINMLYAGGSFGRRGNPHSDYVVEAASIVRALDTRRPIKMVWTREDDTRAGYFRPMYYHTLSAALNSNGKPVAWQHRIVGQSIMTGTAFESSMVKDGVDATSVEGAANLPYAIPNLRVDLHSPEWPVPVQWWRSVGSTHTAFAVETMIDQLARRASRDPVEFRRELLDDKPRHRAVLDLVAEKAGWGGPLPEGRARGIALHKSFNSYVAEVAEVTLHADNRFSVDKVIIAIDCGIAVTPDVIRAQMEGGMGFGLSPALMSEITLDNGAVVQGNYHDFQMLTIDQMPEVEVHIVKSTQPPTGVGEPATPVIAPAVANALSALTGQSFQRLPLTLSA
ncbi:MAG: xanthine dehydrogenase family protein molybdopterin-binding subunit [Thiohalophilus sp.]|uniref:xanthine dehydrogenase family protein molybdopterin-binding subunit n=1 Tax=Thiohalophilus sp. TaxID=3028392 RepID=UPI00287025C4|nr:xanthine dehydrogenase family protein molybdopterin-binding subunit [Thiohalophilus sp.]MDR9436324.1 xanthine dehydrogenase family protein molybdopterin-binding subunit [Thiohalophilus sp.]